MRKNLKALADARRKEIDRLHGEMLHAVEMTPPTAMDGLCMIGGSQFQGSSLPQNFRDLLSRCIKEGKQEVGVGGAGTFVKAAVFERRTGLGWWYRQPGTLEEQCGEAHAMWVAWAKDVLADWKHRAFLLNEIGMVRKTITWGSSPHIGLCIRTSALLASHAISQTIATAIQTHIDRHFEERGFKWAMWVNNYLYGPLVRGGADATASEFKSARRAWRVWAKSTLDAVEKAMVWGGNHA